MNAVLKTEAVAIEAAAPLEMADPSKNLILVPLSQLLPRAPSATPARCRACPSPNWPRALPASACCKTSSSSFPPMARLTRWWPAIAA